MIGPADPRPRESGPRAPPGTGPRDPGSGPLAPGGGPGAGPTGPRASGPATGAPRPRSPGPRSPRSPGCDCRSGTNSEIVIAVFDKETDFKFSHGIPAATMVFGVTGDTDCRRVTAKPDRTIEIEIVKTSFIGYVERTILLLT